MRKTLLLLVLGAFGALVGANGEISARVIATILDDVHTEFGTYHPYPEESTLKARVYQVTEGFSNVGNFSEFGFSARDTLLLRRNLFVVKPSNYAEDYD